MSNKELAQILIADPSTIQRSIDRLVQTELITKKIVYVDNRPKRVLIYNVKVVGELFGELHGELYNASV
jgi:predicted transcriptional regulator